MTSDLFMIHRLIISGYVNSSCFDFYESVSLVREKNLIYVQFPVGGEKMGLSYMGTVRVIGPPLFCS